MEASNTANKIQSVRAMAMSDPQDGGWQIEFANLCSGFVSLFAAAEGPHRTRVVLLPSLPSTTWVKVIKPACSKFAAHFADFGLITEGTDLHHMPLTRLRGACLRAKPGLCCHRLWACAGWRFGLLGAGLTSGLGLRRLGRSPAFRRLQPACHPKAQVWAPLLFASKPS
jgi:hypothetical protein